MQGSSSGRLSQSRSLVSERLEGPSLSKPTSSANRRWPRSRLPAEGLRLSTVFERLLTSFQNILKIPELRTRILFTLTMLAVYRVGAHIPTPGINNEELSKFLLEKGGLMLRFLDMFFGCVVSWS